MINLQENIKKEYEQWIKPSNVFLKITWQKGVKVGCICTFALEFQLQNHEQSLNLYYWREHLLTS
jgi:hypothetical protein